MQLSSNPSPFVDARIKRDVELPLKLPEAQPVEHPEQEQNDPGTGCLKPDCLKPRRGHSEGEHCAFIVQHTIVVACNHAEGILPGCQASEDCLSPALGF